jgi:hypothetical protein
MRQQRHGMSARRIGGVIVALALALAALLVVGLVAVRAYVGSRSGRARVERKVDDALARRLGGGHVEIGRVSGTLVGGVTLDDVRWRDGERTLVQARRMVVRWSAARALARRPAIELRLESPDVDLEALARRVDLGELARLVDAKRDAVTAITVSHLEVVDGTVRGWGRTVSHVTLSGAGHLDEGEGEGGRLGDRGELSLEHAGARAALEGTPLGVAAGGRLRWDRAQGLVTCSSLRVTAGASVATVDARLAGRDVDIRLDQLRLSPRDLRRLSPRADAPRTALTGSARLSGRRDDAAITGELRPDAGAIRISGRVDLAAGRGHVQLTLDDVESDYSPAVLAGTIEARGGLAGRTLAVDWSADGHYFRREVNPNLPPERRRPFATVRPGGRFQASGRLTAALAGRAPSGSMPFRLVVHDAGQAARLLAGPDLPASPAPLVIEGRWQLRPGASPTLTMHTSR